MKTQATIIEMTRYQELMQTRLEEAIASVVFYPEFGFATVASHSKPGDVHIVDIDKNFYALDCDCIGNHEHGKDCLHMLAVDRVGDTIRPDFYTLHHIARPASRRAA